jgi:hypothetical protein
MSIWLHMMGKPQRNGRAYEPLDPADFGRCQRLLKAFPEWRERIREMAVYPGWAGLVGAWDMLEALYAEERPKGAAPKLYARMQELRGTA